MALSACHVTPHQFPFVSECRGALTLHFVDLHVHFSADKASLGVPGVSAPWATSVSILCQDASFSVEAAGRTPEWVQTTGPVDLNLVRCTWTGPWRFLSPPSPSSRAVNNTWVDVVEDHSWYDVGAYWGSDGLCTFPPIDGRVCRRTALLQTLASGSCVKGCLWSPPPGHRFLPDTRPWVMATPLPQRVDWNHHPWGVSEGASPIEILLMGAVTWVHAHLTQARLRVSLATPTASLTVEDSQLTRCEWRTLSVPHSLFRFVNTTLSESRVDCLGEGKGSFFHVTMHGTRMTCPVLHAEYSVFKASSVVHHPWVGAAHSNTLMETTWELSGHPEGGLPGHHFQTGVNRIRRRTPHVSPVERTVEEPIFLGSLLASSASVSGTDARQTPRRYFIPFLWPDASHLISGTQKEVLDSPCLRCLADCFDKKGNVDAFLRESFLRRNTCSGCLIECEEAALCYMTEPTITQFLVTLSISVGGPLGAIVFLYFILFSAKRKAG